MLLQDFLPATALRNFIKCYRIVDLCFDPTQAVPFKAYPPKPEQLIQFTLRGSLRFESQAGVQVVAPDILFKGQQTSLVNQFIGHQFTGVQIVFEPTAVFQITGIPATALTNQFLDATLLFSTALHTTRTALLAAANYPEMLRAVEALSFELVRKARAKWLLLDAACRQMSVQHGNVSIDWLAAQSCYSNRQFSRKFTERAGVCPKTYARLLRLNRAYNMRNCFPGKSWVEIAAHCGYTDYQHLAKDYKAFNWCTPMALQVLDQQSPEQVLGLTGSVYRSRVFGVG